MSVDRGSSFPILIINGPNLGYLGKRQPEIYGHEGLDAIPEYVERLLGSNSSAVTLQFFQSNSEGALIDRIEQAWEDKVKGIVINAGAFTHTSLALADCFAWIDIPFVEVHISNVYARAEAVRHHSYLAKHALGCMCGFGLTGYALAVQALYSHLSAKRHRPIK